MPAELFTSNVRLWLEEGPPTVAAATVGSSLSRALWLVLAGGLACLVAAVALLGWGGWRTPQDERSIRFSIAPPRGMTFDTLLSATAVSPDGRSIVFSANTATTDGGLYLHSLDSGSTRFLSGTEHGDYLWSPDSQSLAFIGLGKLKRLKIVGGSQRRCVRCTCNRCRRLERRILDPGFSGRLVADF